MLFCNRLLNYICSILSSRCTMVEIKKKTKSGQSAEVPVRNKTRPCFFCKGTGQMSDVAVVDINAVTSKIASKNCLYCNGKGREWMPPPPSSKDWWIFNKCWQVELSISCDMSLFLRCHLWQNASDWAIFGAESDQYHCYWRSVAASATIQLDWTLVQLFC